MCSLYGAYDSSAIGVLLLAAVAAPASIFTCTAVRRTATAHQPAPHPVSGSRKGSFGPE
ncbi:hypothetical protein [Streptomyces sp. CC219B]|uniref:hypothetical protein n=1 Tax=Streptomyces sp. CC219B TaxID=3044574 RepID=UPI0024A84F38|nr:hypothetical protein [Streptomyces sp. CC219B]